MASAASPADLGAFPDLQLPSSLATATAGSSSGGTPLKSRKSRKAPSKKSPRKAAATAGSKEDEAAAGKRKIEGLLHQASDSRYGWMYSSRASKRVRGRLHVSDSVYESP
jgi:hypothetical protein